MEKRLRKWAAVWSRIRPRCAISLGKSTAAALSSSRSPREYQFATDTLPLGTRLIREWNGITHRVEVEKEGLLWRGTHYSSLSAVARAITGARWSGPRFFNVPGKLCP